MCRGDRGVPKQHEFWASRALCYQGSFKNYVDKMRWVGGQSNVSPRKVGSQSIVNVDKNLKIKRRNQKNWFKRKHFCLNMNITGIGLQAQINLKITASAQQELSHIYCQIHICRGVCRVSRGMGIFYVHVDKEQVVHQQVNSQVVKIGQKLVHVVFEWPLRGIVLRRDIHFWKQ